uniref:Ribosomal protein L19 n=1 Tax=Dichotomosiphon tuberosus TaxID=118263 RepID=A0A386AWZ6_9CHLO|nr:ribosomal protein L19 [Dichotomosiphon tuberosus]
MLLQKSISNFQQKQAIQYGKVSVGDYVKIGIKINEGDKSRIQFFEGIIISINNNTINTTITVFKRFQDIGIEQIFPLASPIIKSFKIIKNQKLHRAKLFYLKKRNGKNAIKITRNKN